MGAADGDFGLALVVHAELVTGFEPGDDFADVVEVDDESAMSAPEEGGSRRSRSSSRVRHLEWPSRVWVTMRMMPSSMAAKQMSA